MRKLKISELNRLSPEQYRESAKIPLVVVLDNIRSLHNAGSVFRTADAFRVEAVFLCGITAVPPSPEIHKTALGAEDSVAWHYGRNTLEVVQELKASGYVLCAAEQAEGSIPPERMEIKSGSRYALIFGHEVKGVAQEVVNICDCCIEIPQFGTKHSLNVSVAAGILVWEFFRKMSAGE